MSDAVGERWVREKNLSRAGPRTDGAFAWGLRDRLLGGIAEREQNIFCALGAGIGEVERGGTKRVETEVRVAGGTLDAIEESGEVDELRAVLHEVEVEDLLPCHRSMVSRGTIARFRRREIEFLARHARETCQVRQDDSEKIYFRKRRLLLLAHRGTADIDTESVHLSKRSNHRTWNAC